MLSRVGLLEIIYCMYSQIWILWIAKLLYFFTFYNVQIGQVKRLSPDTFKVKQKLPMIW